MRLAIGLAEAAHSNRTLIWGNQLPVLLGATAPVWRRGTAAYTDGRGLVLNCTTHGGGGAFGCLYEPLSSCSLADVAAVELEALGAGEGFRDSARVRLQELRRGPALFVPPPQFRDGLLATPRDRHRWAGAIAAYVARLTSGVRSVFESQRAALDMGEHPWAMHVRHGDVAAPDAVYGDRRVYTFSDFVDAIMDLASESVEAHEMTADPNRRAPPLPSAVYIASDNPDTERAVSDARERLKSWPQTAPPPRLVTAPASARWRPRDHNGAAHAAAFASRDARALMRVIVEAAEELHILGSSTAIVTQGTSAFSAFASLLVAANTDGAFASFTPRFIDSARIRRGQLRSGFALQSFGGTTALPKERWGERWSELEAHFAAAPMSRFNQDADAPERGEWVQDKTKAAFERSVPGAPLYGLAADGLPRMDERVFDAQARCWVMPAALDCDAACGPLLPDGDEESAPSAPEALVRASSFYARGAAWVRRVPAVAFACWSAAASALDDCDAARCAVRGLVQGARDDIATSVEAAAAWHLQPYAKERQKVKPVPIS